ncbi:MAG: hypothetical protein K2N24_11185, partial [Lachnospiraceae bacterium]|nr:hypothetical protein [Lachnospiraceae bacterium]
MGKNKNSKKKKKQKNIEIREEKMTAVELEEQEGDNSFEPEDDRNSEEVLEEVPETVEENTSAESSKT